ncbi:MAG: hypothetical protein KGY54_05190, partial [Oleiphilaceae bacterium]|nr:hypothetical protein [Oleiphilaceae bacterium]
GDDVELAERPVSAGSNDGDRAFPEDRERTASLANLRKLVSSPSQEPVEPKPLATPDKVKPRPVTPRAEATDVRAERSHAPAASLESDLSAAPEAVPARVLVEAYWGLWRTDHYLLVSALSLDASDQLQQSLAKNILGAMASEIKSTQVVNWPVFNNPAIPGNDEEGFRGLLRALRIDCPQLEFIALGLCQGDEWADRDEWLKDALGDPVIDFEHSLAALAADPVRKKALWEKLRLLNRPANV